MKCIRKYLLFSVILFSTGYLTAQTNLMSNWDGGGATGSGSEPNNFGWDCLPAITWTEANVFGVRYQDNVTYTYKGNSLTGRVLFVRWDGVGGSGTGSVFSYPAELESCMSYTFNATIAWHANSTSPTFNYNINSAKDNSGISLASGELNVPSTGELKDIELTFTTSEAGTYYFTLGSSSAVLGGIRDISLEAYSGGPFINVSPQQLAYDSVNLSNEFTVYGEGLSEAISLSGPEGMSFSPETITATEAQCGVNVQAIFNDVSDLGDGVITISSGALSREIIVKEILPPFMAPGTRELTSDGTWCWFQDPRAVYYEGVKKQTYTGWITSEGDVQVASYNHETSEYNQYTLYDNFQVDDHNNPTFLIREDGRILASYSGHFYGPMRVVVSTNREDITSFGSEATFGNNVTYANPYQIGDSTAMFYRDGSTWHPTMNVSTDGGLTWGTPQEFITRGGSQQRPYVKYTQDSSGGMHITFTTGHPRQEPANKIYYVYFKNSKFYKADGTFIKNYNGAADALDIDAGEPEVVYDASKGKGWTWDIALDEEGNPVILYAAFPDDMNHHYYYAHWDGTNWVNNHIVNSGRWFPQTPEGGREPEPNYSGGMAVDPNDPSVVYLSKQVDGVFEIFKYTTSDKGVTWETEQITKNTPEGILNVRPVIPRNHPSGSFDVMWMRGKYITYQNYHTSIMYYSPNLEDADLDSIYIDGVKLEGFHPDSLSYSILLAEQNASQPTVTGYSGNPFAKVEVSGTYPGIISIKVTSEGNVREKVYTLEFKEPEAPLDLKESSGFNIFPNPASDYLRVNISDINLINPVLKAYDLSGRLHAKYDLPTGDTFLINISGLEDGIYILKISNNGSAISRKFIKKTD